MGLSGNGYRNISAGRRVLLTVRGAAFFCGGRRTFQKDNHQPFQHQSTNQFCTVEWSDRSYFLVKATLQFIYSLPNGSLRPQREKNLWPDKAKIELLGANAKASRLEETKLCSSPAHWSMEVAASCCGDGFPAAAPGRPAKMEGKMNAAMYRDVLG